MRYGARMLRWAVALALSALAGPGGAWAQEGSACAIKGNVSDAGRLFYVPEDPRYAKVNINRAGERWFCSEAEAVAAGWEKAEHTTKCIADAADLVPDPRAPSPDCAIKGNQSGIYHVPGGGICYAETTIRAGNRKEAWFCSEAEAVAAGYRRSRK